MSENYAVSERIARAVADDLNAGADQFAVQFTCQFERFPRADLKDLNTLKLYVRDISQSLVGFKSRDLTEHNYLIEIGAWLKIPKSDADALIISRINYLSEQIGDYFRFIPSGLQKWPTGCSERMARVETNMIFSDTDLEQQGLAKFKLVLAFRGWR